MGRGYSSTYRRQGKPEEEKLGGIESFDSRLKYQKIKAGETQEQAIEAISKLIADKRVEYAVVITPDGIAYINRGGKTSATTPWKEFGEENSDISRMGEEGYVYLDQSDAVAMHNHPLGQADGRSIGGPPSVSDLQMIPYCKKEVVAAKEGVYTFSVSDESKREALRTALSKNPRDKRMTLLDSLINEYYDESPDSDYGVDFNDSGGTTDEFLRATHDYFKANLGKYGVSYNFKSSTATDVYNDLAEKHNKWYEEYKKKYSKS